MYLFTGSPKLSLCLIILILYLIYFVIGRQIKNLRILKIPSYLTEIYQISQGNSFFQNFHHLHINL